MVSGKINDNSDKPASARLLEQPPAEVAQQLNKHGIDREQLLLSACTDIGLLGQYRDHWLSVTNDRLMVICDGAEPSLAMSLCFDDAKEFRTQPGVGSGILQAKVNGTYVDVLRYSNRRAFRFEKIATKLNRHLQGERIEIHPDDEVDPRRCPKCGLMLDAGGGGDSSGCPQCVSRGTVLIRMLKLMRPYRTGAIVMMCLLVVGIALDLVSPQLTRYLVDNVLPGSASEAAALQAAPMQVRDHLNMLLVVVLILAGVQILRQFINLLNGRLGSKIGTSITFDMRGRMVNHLQQLSIGFYDRQQVGSLVGRVAYDTEALHGFINQLTSGFLLQVLMLLGVGVMMFVIDPKLAAFTLIPAPLVVAGTIVFWRYIYPRNYQAWDASSKQAGMLSGLLSGVRVVKAFGQEKHETQRFNNVSEYLRNTRRGVDIAMNTFNPIMGIVFMLGGWIVWYVGGRDVIESRMTLGELMAFFGYLWMFYGPLGGLPLFTNWLTSFATQAHRIFEILDTPSQIAESNAPVQLEHMRGHIKFENVSFGYNRHSPVLRDLTLEVKPGEMLGVVGHSGSGKTTIVNLLCRFYDVNEGRVLIDDVDVRDMASDALRSRIGVVLQEPFLFRGSILENISYGKPPPNGATPEEIIAASKAGNCHDFIVRQPHAYDTWVGERGAGLSGGEKQRIGIARVLLTDPRVLILDEATSSVDTESEAAIQAALAELTRGRTTIAIAHRLSTLRNSNRIVVVDQGRIIESGTHAELIAQGGQFARMVNIQQGEGTRNDGQGSTSAHSSNAQCLIPGASFHPRWLTPDCVRIHLGSHDALHVTIRSEGIYGGVFAVRCFPVHFPNQYISLRYIDSSGHDVELGIVRDINSNEWPEETRRLVHESLCKRYFVHTILAIDDIEQINNYLNFKVETDLGPQRFTLRWQQDRAQDYGANGKGKMLLDTDENRYLIPDISKLPDRERRLLLRFIYW